MAIRSPVPPSDRPADAEPSTPGPSSMTIAAPPDLTDEVDWVDDMDSEGESYVLFSLDEEWPGPYGSASRGAP